MKLNDYELVISNVMPCYWYDEDIGKYSFYIDEQTCDEHKFFDNNDFSINEKETRKWWKLMLYKPNDIEKVTKDNIKCCKWLVEDCYHHMINVYDDPQDDTDYEKYEWDFKNHCIKKD